LAEANNVSHPVAINVCKLTWVGILAAPTTGNGTKRREFECRRQELLPVAQGVVDPGLAEANDVGPAVAVNVAKLTRVQVIA